MVNLNKPDGAAFIVSEFVLLASELPEDFSMGVTQYVLNGYGNNEYVNAYTCGVTLLPSYLMDEIFTLAPDECQGGVRQNADWVANGGYYGLLEKQGGSLT